MADYRDYSTVIRYLKETQYPQRRYIAAPWTSQYRNYGNITTSKLESARYQAKYSLLHNQGHLLDVVQKLENYWDIHFESMKLNLHLSLSNSPLISTQRILRSGITALMSLSRHLLYGSVVNSLI
jgi:hypothetical protein